MLADTSFIIDLMLNDRDAITKAKEMERENVGVLVSAPTIFELYVGVGLSVRSIEEKEKILRVMHSLTTVALDSSSATRAGFVYAQKVKDGSRMNPIDALLAGIAIENHQPLLTRNRKDFVGILELKVESY